MKMRLTLLFVAVLLAPVWAHGAGFPAIGHFLDGVGDAGAFALGTPAPPTPHTGNLSAHMPIPDHGNIVSRTKAADPTPDVDQRHVDWDNRKAVASAGNGEADNGTGTHADDEEESEEEEEEGEGWDRLWDTPKLG